MKKKYEKPKMVTQVMDLDLLRACANVNQTLASRDTTKHINCFCCVHKSTPGGTGFQHLSSPT
jgi:hypothetical protein